MCLFVDHWLTQPHENPARPAIREAGTTAKKILKARKPKRAKEDMIVFKILELHTSAISKQSRLVSPYQSMEYELGKVYRSSKADIAMAREDALREGQVWGGAFHAHTGPKHLAGYTGGAVYQATIPKGALYWLDKDFGEIAATKIRIDHKLYNLEP